MATLYDRAGQPVDVPDDQAAAALASGDYGLPKGRINLLSPEGETRSYSTDHAFELLSNGFSLETGAQRTARQEEKKFGDRPVAAALAGAGRGATLGLSDLALTKLGLVEPKTLKGIDEHNRPASIGGEVLGVGGTALIPGLGEATAGKLAARAGMAAERVAAGALGEGLASRVGASVVRTATEGSLFGLGKAVSESALGDTELTAQKLVAGAGVGALAGGVLGGGLHLAGEGVAAALGGADLKGALEAHAEKWTLKAIAGNAQKTALDKIKNKGIRGDLADFIHSEGFLEGGASAEKQVGRIEESVQKYGAAVGKTLDAGDATGQRRISGELLADRIESELVAPLDSGNLGERARAKMIQGEADIIREKGDLGFRQTTDMMRRFDGDAKHGVLAKEYDKADLYRKLTGILKDETEKQVEAFGEGEGTGLGKQQLEEYLANKKGYRLSLESKALAEGRAAQLERNNSIGLRDTMVGTSTAAGAIASGHPLAALGAVATALGSKVLRERGPQLYASALNKLTRSGVFDSLAESFQQGVSKQLDTAPQLFGGFRNVLAAASARGADDLLATHVGLYQKDPAYRNQMALAGYAPESPEESDAAVARLHQLQSVKGALAGHDAQADAALGRFLGKQGGAAPRAAESLPRKERLAQFDAQAKKLEALSNNPDALANAIIPGNLLTHAAPGVAVATSATAARALQYLQLQIPKNPNPQILPALEQPWKPSDSQLAAWEKRLAAVNNPASVLGELKRGTITKESVEALRAVYPALLQDIQRRTMEKLAGHAEPLSYAQRATLSTLMGQPMGGVASPALVGVFQQAHASAKKAEAHANAKRQMKLAEGMSTAAQRIEGR